MKDLWVFSHLCFGSSSLVVLRFQLDLSFHFFMPPHSQIGFSFLGACSFFITSYFFGLAPPGAFFYQGW